MTRALRRLRAEDGERGAYAAEFSLIAPIIFLVIAFGYSMANAMWTQAELNRVAELASRAVAVSNENTVQGRSYRTQEEVFDAVEAVSPNSAGRFTGTAPDLTLEVLDASGAVLSAADYETIPEGAAFVVRVSKTFDNPMGRVLAQFGGPEIDGGVISAERIGVRE